MTESSEKSTSERTAEILARQERGEDEHYEDSESMSASGKRAFVERKKPGRKPVPTTEELEIELFEINTKHSALNRRANQIRSILKERY